MKKKNFAILFFLLTYGILGGTISSFFNGNYIYAIKNNQVSNQVSLSNDNSAIVISDDITLWNDDNSRSPSIAIDTLNTVHVVWYDYTNGTWGSDIEIMYCTYTATAGWSNATVISDDETNWNNDDSYTPSIAVDSLNTVHVVWYDHTDGTWGSDTEIMYCNYTAAAGWSNATVISDDETNWNNDDSYTPSIAVDSLNTVHVVWYDSTDGIW
ncbi:MAG: hypothetical protein EU541_04575, partial [Promethearchaeota archaeon]